MRDVGQAQVFQRELHQRAACLQFMADLQKRVLAGDHFRRPVRREHEDAQVGEALGQVVEHVDRGDVGPVQIVQEEHERPRARNGFEQRASPRFMRSGDVILVSSFSCRAPTLSMLSMPTCTSRWRRVFIMSVNRPGTVPATGCVRAAVCRAPRESAGTSPPASRSEHRPPRSRDDAVRWRSRQDSSTRLVLPMPGSPVIVATRPARHVP